MTFVYTMPHDEANHRIDVTPQIDNGKQGITSNSRNRQIGRNTVIII